MTKAAMIFSFFCGIAMFGVWATLLLTGGVPEVATTPLVVIFLLAAEFTTAGSLLVAGYGLLSRRAWGLRAELAALGMLVYCTIYSIGVFGQQSNLPATAFFVVIAALALVFCGYFVRTASAGSLAGRPEAGGKEA